MKIVADENIVFLNAYFANPHVEIILKPGRAICSEDLIDADVLLVRSITSVNKELLAGTSVKFVGSVTTGTDHLDVPWLENAGIVWSAAEGCNAVAVAEYVVSVIASLQKTTGFSPINKRAGIIGVGRIGRLVADKLKILGFDVVLCDPVRAENEKDFVSTPLSDFVDLDFITLHTPLTHEGPHATYHLIEKDFLQRQKKNCILLNAGRGAVIDFADLKRYGKHLQWCLDVWEEEPQIDLEVLQQAVIATPHIAGYSVQSKCRGVEMIYQAACQQGYVPQKAVAPMCYPTQLLTFQDKKIAWHDVVLEIYNPLSTTQNMKSGAVFDDMRKQFNDRHECAFLTLRDCQLSENDKTLLRQLGLKN